MYFEDDQLIPNLNTAFIINLHCIECANEKQKYDVVLKAMSEIIKENSLSFTDERTKEETISEDT